MLLLWFVSVASAAVTDPTAARHEFLKNGTVEIVEYAVRAGYSADDDIEIFFGEYRIACESGIPIPGSEPLRVVSVVGVDGTVEHLSWGSSVQMQKDQLHVGVMSGQQFDKLKRWFVEDWARHKDTFDPITIIDAEAGTRVWMSRMCHDLVEYGLKRMAEMGVSLRPARPLLRDHITVYVKPGSLKPLDVRGNAFNRRAVARFMRVYLSFIPKLRDQFIHARDFLRKVLAMDLTPVGYLLGQYYEAEVVSPLVNYCYVPLRMPRLLGNGTVVFGEVDAMKRNRSLCALRNDDVELDNVTLTLEDRLIMLENYIDVFFNAPERGPHYRWAFMTISGTVLCALLSLAYLVPKRV
ncbi:hypothetical protein FOZ62_014157, partial [Perkinsus olseni]